ncbi:MAG: hypothetical protein DRI94_13185 [Bacteroidetes bacterium]|nr:MAG: hypothetical protein DRI94_13185 [Bacteroidota bacterium]
MKKIILLSVFFYVFSFIGKSQTFNIAEGTAVNDDMARPCITVTFEPDASEAKKAWKNYLKKKYDLKLKSDRGDDLKAEEAVFPAVTSRTMDFYTRFEKDKDNHTTKMNVFVKFGYDIYLNNTDNPSEYSSLMSIVKDFSVEFLRTYYSDNLEILNSELAKTEKEQAHTLKENETLASDIEKNKQTIEDLKKENEEKTAQIEANKKTIVTLTEKVTAKKEEIQKMNEVINGIK